MLNPSINSCHLVLTLRPETCAVKKVPQKDSTLVIKIKESTQALALAEPTPNDAMLLIDLTSKDYWRNRCLREIDYATLLTDVMPKLGIPNYVLLDREFVALSRQEQKTRLKELCEAVEGVMQEMKTFDTVTLTFERCHHFYPNKTTTVNRTVLRNAEGLSTIALMHKHKLPTGFRLSVIKGTDGVRTCLKFEDKIVIKIFADSSTKETTLTDWLDKMAKNLQSSGPRLGIGKIEFYQSTPSSPNWHSESKSVFQNPKTIVDKPNAFYDC